MALKPGNVETQRLQFFYVVVFEPDLCTLRDGCRLLSLLRLGAHLHLCGLNTKMDQNGRTRLRIWRSFDVT